MTNTSIHISRTEDFGVVNKLEPTVKSDCTSNGTATLTLKTFEETVTIFGVSDLELKNLSLAISDYVLKKANKKRSALGGEIDERECGGTEKSIQC